MSKGKSFIKAYKENKKLQYAVNIFILLIIVSLVLKLDVSNITGSSAKNASSDKIAEKSTTTNDSYVHSLESRMEEIIYKIQGISSVDVMIYTKNTPELKPVYDENTSSESNIEIGSDGVKREVKKETRQNEVVMGSDNQVVEKYYQYPEITGVLIVVKYVGQKDIYSILINSVKTLFNVNLNDIEIVITWGGIKWLW